MKKYKYCLTTRHDVYEYSSLKEMLNHWIKLINFDLPFVRGWRTEIN